MADQQVMGSIKSMLLERLTKLTEHINSEAGHADGERRADVLDDALHTYDDVVSTQLIENELREIGQIKKALGKLADGTYGVCELCRKPIPAGRLELIPYLTNCKDCQLEMESGGCT